MKLAQTVRLGAWILIVLNLLMATGSIWVFIRMAPAIEVIIKQNQRSLQACEKMLAALAMKDLKGSHRKSPQASFLEALHNAKSNITEDQEPLAIQTITQLYKKAFNGNATAIRQTVEAILLLDEINSNAMAAADMKAKQLGDAGAWGIVFMATGVFLTGMLFIRSLKRSLLKPLEEIKSVLSAYRQGDRLRRCTGSDLPNDVKAVFNDINEFLDQNDRF